MPTPSSPAIDTVDALVQLAFGIQRLFEQHAARADLSVPQARMLGALRDREPAMSELGALLDLDKSSVSGLVDRAERRGLVSRVPSADDRRSVRVSLTGPGRALIDTAADRFAVDLEQMLGALSAPERKTWTRLSAKLVSADAAARGIRL